MLLNYLGPQIGAGGPIASQLPQGSPGTMPGGVPGVARANVPAPTPPIHAAPQSAPHPAVHGRVPPSPQALAAIMHGAHGGGPAGPPPLPKYGTHTQSDGSVLMYVENPDGSPGPVVKIIPPIKRAEPSAPAPAA